MRWLQGIPWLLGVNGIILLIATTHLRKTSKWVARAFSSIGVFLLTVPVVALFGMHHCDEGSSPPFIMYAAASLAAVYPWISPAGNWLIRGLIAITVSAGILTASFLRSSYHYDTITGNPNYASERFWHTSLSGQYPRDREKMEKLRRKRLGKADPPEQPNSEQNAAPNP